MIGVDKDPQALEIARTRLAPAGEQWPEVRLEQGSFAGLEQLLPEASADGLLADLGMSSLQLRDAARGGKPVGQTHCIICKPIKGDLNLHERGCSLH